MKYIDKELLMEYLQNKFESYKSKMVDPSKYPINHIDFMAFLAGEYQALILQLEERLPEVQPEVFDTVAFQKGVAEGRRLEREDALTIADIEKLHTFLYAVKNNKQGAFTFTRLSDEQYEEVLRRFNNAKEK